MRKILMDLFVYKEVHDKGWYTFKNKLYKIIATTSIKT